MSATHDPIRRRVCAAGAVTVGAASIAGCASPGAAPGAASGVVSGARVTRPDAIGDDAVRRPVRIASPDVDPAYARHLLNRFGYGPRPGDVERVCEQGASAWLDAQLAPATPHGVDAPTNTSQATPGTAVATHPRTLVEFARLQTDVLRSGIAEGARADATRAIGELVRRVQGEARAERLRDALDGERQLEASLVEFWFNHFNVFAGKQTVRVTAGFYEREAIRPHVLGRFRDLLGATARHPAMLDYLDNAQNVVDAMRAPQNAALPPGIALPRGINENYARELLELHTLGVDGGYSQADVTELARVLTGWSFDRRDGTAAHAFRFFPARHDGRPKTLLGAPVDGQGVEQGERVLDRLARHPSTARHVARRLATWYVADAPPPPLVDRLAARFAATDGDLRQVVRELAESDAFRDPANRGAKFKTPYHYVVSSVRAVGAPRADRPDPARLAGAIARMGMPIFGCPTPDGWKDTREAWLNAEGLRQRVEFAVQLARGGPGGMPQARRMAVSDTSLQGLPEPVVAALGAGARAALAEATPGERLAVALASPDFMKR